MGLVEDDKIGEDAVGDGDMGFQIAEVEVHVEPMKQNVTEEAVSVILFGLLSTFSFYLTVLFLCYAFLPVLLEAAVSSF